MSLADLSSIGSLGGGVAVVLSLLFVGFQLRQNTRAAKASASQAHALNWQQITLPIIENAEPHGPGRRVNPPQTYESCAFGRHANASAD
jgi:hypothetical protein